MWMDFPKHIRFWVIEVKFDSDLYVCDLTSAMNFYQRDILSIFYHFCFLPTISLPSSGV